MTRKHAMLVVSCDTCLLPMYRTDGRGVFDLDTGEREQPVQIVVANVRRLFCSKSCAARWLIKQPVNALRSGYPIL